MDEIEYFNGDYEKRLAQLLDTPWDELSWIAEELEIVSDRFKNKKELVKAILEAELEFDNEDLIDLGKVDLKINENPE